jgi:hypothetical protein
MCRTGKSDPEADQVAFLHLLWHVEQSMACANEPAIAHDLT